MKVFDKKALKILLNAYWQSGWLDKPASGVNANDILYAKSKGYWFDDFKTSHDGLVSKLIKAREEIRPKEVGDAFLASLSSRRLELRSALGSYAFASNFPKHKLASSDSLKAPSGAKLCKVCNYTEFNTPRTEDLNVMNFERYKWGGVRHDQIIYAWFDLSEFRREIQLHPTEEDIAIFRSILRIASNLPDDARPSTLSKQLGGVLRSNSDERRVLIEILSMAGVLQPRDRPGYFGEFAYPFERKHTGEHHNDWKYPAIWWRGSDGVNRSAVDTYFPEI